MTTMRMLGTGVLALLAVLIAASAATASPITLVDQQNLVGPSLGANETGLGQVFTPTLTSVDAFDVSLKTDATSSTLRLDLYEGSGYLGTLLAQSAQVVVTNTIDQWIHFDLTAAAALTAGDEYTFQVVQVTGDRYGARYSIANPYAGGMMLGANGTTWTGEYDLVFREGLHAAPSVPEPASVLLVLGSAAGLALRRRRSRA